MDLILVVVAALVFLALPFLTVKFPRALLCYLFLFIPLYLFYVDQYIRLLRPALLPDSLRMAKDLAWVGILTGFILWLLLTHGEAIRLPRTIAGPFLLFLLFLYVQWIRGYFRLGPFGAALSLRNTLGYIPAVLMAPLVIKSRRDLLLTAKGFSCVMLAAGLYAVVQVAFHLRSAHYIMTPREGIEDPVASFFADYNAFGWFTAMSFPFVLVFCKFGDKKLLSFAALGLCGFSAVATQSRTGLIAFVFVLLCLCMVQVVKVRRIVVPIVLAIIAFILYEPTMITRHRIAGGVFHDSRFQVVWPSLWRFFTDKPLFGHGLGVFGTAGHTLLSRQGLAANYLVDNFYYSILLNTGLFGLALFLLLVAAIFRHEIKLLSEIKDPLISASVKALSVSLAVFLIFSIPSNFLESFPESVYFWFLVGLLCAAGRINCRRQMNDRAPDIV